MALVVVARFSVSQFVNPVRAPCRVLFAGVPEKPSASTMAANLIYPSEIIPNFLCASRDPIVRSSALTLAKQLFGWLAVGDESSGTQEHAYHPNRQHGSRAA
jgi:hypothetical protein